MSICIKNVLYVLFNLVNFLQKISNVLLEILYSLLKCLYVRQKSQDFSKVLKQSSEALQCKKIVDLAFVHLEKPLRVFCHCCEASRILQNLQPIRSVQETNKKHKSILKIEDQIRILKNREALSSRPTVDPNLYMVYSRILETLMRSASKMTTN